MSSQQASTALDLIRYGVFSQLVGMLWGTQVPQTPYPRLALSGHIQYMSQGGLSFGFGLLLWQKDLLHLNTVQLSIVKWGMLSSVFPAFAGTANAYWGTAKFLSITGEQGGAPGGTSLQEQIVLLFHVVPSIMLLGSVSILLWGLCRAVPKKKDA